MGQPSNFVLTRQEAESAGVVNDPMNLVSLIDRKVSLGLAPISGFNVGAVGLGSSGVVYLGVNIELPGLPLHHSIHAEQFLVTNLVLNSERQLTRLAVSSDGSVFDAPCGHCRQFLQEIREAPKIRILIKNPTKNKNEYVNLDSLLPRPDTNLLPEELPLLLQARHNGLAFLDPVVSAGETDLKSMALAAANKSFAPYSMCPSGVALRGRDGKVYRGWYMESVAYNPSLGPVQAVLVDYVANGGKEFDNIVEAVLVEKKDAMVSQEDTSRMILEKISSRDFVFKVFHCSELAKP
ncbi:hypothetical protein EUTSA_v10026995mg [Eutrema salsugineum]|uniref:cytidine deaminase n=1 Tax=Eutrema salsugineum TaxID=72664 RepID=V4P482_EUTSA|nr:cytidine deaminase 6 [Eutrema salsugineum]ESQ54276.1 hypothetical protein EUTSA_v10026995mg [Eutrema salsugineum]